MAEKVKKSKKQQVIDLHYQGYTIYEIAEILDVTIAFVVNTLELGGYVVK